MFHENTSVIHEVEIGGAQLGPVEVTVIDPVAELEKALLRAMSRDDRELQKLILAELLARREEARCARRPNATWGDGPEPTEGLAQVVELEAERVRRKGPGGAS